MRYSNVCLQALVSALPTEILTSADIERMLAPLYRRLKLPEGRLELMTGIRERRLWPRGFLPSQASAQAARKSLAAARIEPSRVECLVHCGVSRDYVEPATSTAVHRLLGLSSRALNFDLSNACLGVLSGVVLLANMVELGQISIGLAVTGENSRPLLETTIAHLNENTDLSRRDIKPWFASLTIGSAAAAVVVRRMDEVPGGLRLLGGAHGCNTAFNHLCQGNNDAGMTSDAAPVMQTNSEELLVQGVKVAQSTWAATKEELGWHNDTPDVICTHQVGRMHRQQLYEKLELDMARDVATIEFLGNCGSASLPATAAHALATRPLAVGGKLALLGIGSGINCTMLGLEQA